MIILIKYTSINLETNQKNLHDLDLVLLEILETSNQIQKYIAFLDDDDVWMPQKLEKQIEILENSNKK